MRKVEKNNVDNILINQARPENCAAILLSMKKGDLREENEIYKKINMRDVEIDRIIYLRRNFYRLTDLGLLDKIKEGNKIKGYKLTSLGSKAKNLLLGNEDLFYEFMHYLHVKSAFEKEKDGYFLTYFLILRDIYNRGEVRRYNTIISDVFNELENILGAEITHKKGQDNTSVGKAMSWVKDPLNPPFLTNDNEINYRKNVDPFVFIMSLDSYYTKEGIPYKSPIILNKKNKRGISMMGLLNEKYFSKNIERISNIFDELYIRDTVNGKTITLRKEFDIGESV